MALAGMEHVTPVCVVTFSVSDMDTCPGKEINVFITTDSSSRSKRLPASMDRHGRGGSQGGRCCRWRDESISAPRSTWRGTQKISLVPQWPREAGEPQVQMPQWHQDKCPESKDVPKVDYPSLKTQHVFSKDWFPTWKAEVPKHFQSPCEHLCKNVHGTYETTHWGPHKGAAGGKGDVAKATGLHCQTPPALSESPCSPSLGLPKPAQSRLDLGHLLPILSDPTTYQIRPNQCIRIPSPAKQDNGSVYWEPTMSQESSGCFVKSSWQTPWRRHYQPHSTHEKSRAQRQSQGQGSGQRCIPYSCI